VHLSSNQVCGLYVGFPDRLRYFICIGITYLADIRDVRNKCWMNGCMWRKGRVHLRLWNSRTWCRNHWNYKIIL